MRLDFLPQCLHIGGRRLVRFHDDHHTVSLRREDKTRAGFLQRRRINDNPICGCPQRRQPSGRGFQLHALARREPVIPEPRHQQALPLDLMRVQQLAIGEFMLMPRHGINLFGA